MAAMADAKTIGLKSMVLLVVQAEDALQANVNIIYKTHNLNIKELTHWFAKGFCSIMVHLLLALKEIMPTMGDLMGTEILQAALQWGSKGKPLHLLIQMRMQVWLAQMSLSETLCATSCLGRCFGCRFRRHWLMVSL